MSNPHFPWFHQYEGKSSGPFGFLNPTTRQYPVSAQQMNTHHEDETKPKTDGDSDDLPAAQPSTAGKEEVLADDVQRKWRARDNRKGKLLHLIALT